VRRRNRVRFAVAAGIALAILVTSFPLTVLYNQHRQLSAAAAQLGELQHQNALLAEQRQQLNSDAEVKRLAQQNYQLVQPGRSLFVILPPAGQTTTSGAPTAGDPADQPLVSPAQAPNMSPDPGLPATPVASSGPSSTAGTPPPGAAHPPTGYLGRIVSSLEFWK
jgi:cell division protein FtsB